jgi:hypothetical protein
MRFHRGVTTTLLTLTFAVATAVSAAAQPAKRITVGGRPTPGQDIRLNIVQEADLTMKPAAAAADSPMGSMHLKGRTTTVVSQRVGTPDAQGAIKVEMTYEDISQEMTMNDQPAPPEAAAVATRMKGKTLSMTLDAAGEVVDVTPPADFPLPTGIIKEMLKQALGLMPRQELTVGESVSAPFQMAMPVPMGGSDPPQLKGTLTSKLTGVSGAPGSEVAALEQVMDASVDATMQGQQGGGDVAVKMTVKGSGTTDWDVKGALVKASRMTTQINGTFSAAGMGTMEMTGTTTVNLERVP